MSKLAIVRSSLQVNTNIQIVAVDERTYFPEPHGYWTHTVDFIVAPNTGIYAAPKLQEFMLALMPALPPTSVDKFYDWDTTMELGKLYFDEDLGKETITHNLVLTESDFLPMGSVEDGKTCFERERKIQRRTWVRVYPDVEIAMLHQKYEYRVPRTDLKVSQSRGKKQGFIGRIGNMIKSG